ncbi:hypothetical protein [Blastococcus atacamensis]|uniref:hypothetical protein n=1 Tax=Blastococcus atacamensis TaxID=2070508 RepID=UPI001E4BE114|nr:hypothetical protein [Blastococcus atacamensis]
MTKHLLPPVYTLAAAEVAELTRAELRDDGVRVFRGVYRSRALPADLATTVEAALSVLPPRASVSHRTAAALLGAPIRPGPLLEFAVPPGVHRARRRGLRVHVRDLAGVDETLLDGLRVTSGPQTWLDLAASLTAGELVAVGDALYRGGHLDGGNLTERLARADGVRGVVQARACAPLLTPLAASRPESLVRYAVVSGGLPHPVVQVPVLDRWGRAVAHADLGWPQWKVALEYEGRQHADSEQFGRDIDRYSLMAADGWLTVRFAARHLDRLDVVVARAAGALRSRGARW